MTTKQAPTLFGKRMQANGSFSFFSPVVAPLGERIWVDNIAGGWFADRGCTRISSRARKSAQAAARDAERYLRRLHKALGKVIGE